MSFSDAGSTMSTRPDRPLIVKATFDRYNKRITFSSARNCSYDLLRSKVEQSFSLQAFSFSIAYKDDDGEVTDITTESNLTEAIQYFQAGVDDLPVSSAASILSGRSFGSRRITLRVTITVDYDGPSLSDTSSLVSLEEYKNRNGSGSSLSLSFSASSQVEPEDDSVTVSSRDTGMMAQRTQTKTVMRGGGGGSGGDSGSTVHDYQSMSDLQSESDASSFGQRYPEDPSAVFERLKMSDSNGYVERNTQWLRDQTSRNNLNGILTSESESGGSSLNLEDDLESQSPFDGDLALQQDNGKYYYTYTSGSSSSAASAAHDDGDYVENGSSRHSADYRSQKLHWIASQQTITQTQPPKTLSHPAASSAASSSSSRPSMYSSSSDPLPRSSISEDIPPEVLQFMLENPQPPLACTDCSSCGVLLETFRYVCSTCGEKEPRDHMLAETNGTVNGKGKGRDVSPFDDPLSYPPPSHRSAADKPLPPRPLPTLPLGSHSHSHSYNSGSGSNSSTTTLAGDTGFELCPNCIETAGIFHALAGSAAPDAPDEPASPEDAQRTLSQLRRAAPKQKGHFRHAYVEKLWSAAGWKDVEQDDTGKCTICTSSLNGPRYKCASCTNFVLCRACYSQVHEIHPSHAFLDVPERPLLRARSEPDLEQINIMNDDGLEDESLTHPNVKCAYCLMDIVGARFHCAICDSVDICSNCEAAGLPGNLDAEDGEHISSHIMIKIPIPLKSNKVQDASRRARRLWSGRDAANVQRTPSGRSRSNSLLEVDAETVIGSSKHSHRSARNGEQKSRDHHILCKGCNQSIIGIRYQCATCPSTNNSTYSLCEKCEARSYLLHDPMHIFLKLPRPVDRPIESPFPIIPILYKQPAGPRAGETLNSSLPKAYLKTLNHNAALCDHCMERITGEWFRCVYCPKDLCDVCEDLDAHNPKHFFYVFKAPVDMQLFRIVAELDNPNGSPPVLKYPVYNS